MRFRKITETTSIKRMSLSKRKKLTDFLMDFCKKNIGVNPYKRDKAIYSISNEKRNDVYGFCLNGFLIVVYAHMNPEVKEFVKTFIHEYTHTTQPILSQYSKLYRKYGYDNHPHEIEACYYEELLYKKAIKEFNETL